MVDGVTADPGYDCLVQSSVYISRILIPPWLKSRKLVNVMNNKCIATSIKDHELISWCIDVYINKAISCHPQSMAYRV